MDIVKKLNGLTYLVGNFKCTRCLQDCEVIVRENLGPNFSELSDCCSAPIKDKNNANINKRKRRGKS